MKERKDLIYIPSYIIKTLELNNITLEMFYDGLTDVKNIKNFISKIKEILTDTDISILVGLNRRITRYLNVPNTHNFHLSDSIDNLHYSIKDNYVKDSEILELFNSKKINLLVSNENNDSYTFKTLGSTIFVVVHTGFTDFIVYNDLLTKNKYVQDLLDYMISVFGEDIVKDDIFKTYFSLRITKK